MEDEQRYLVYQLERGDGGTPHLQGYVYYDTAKSLRSVKERFPRAHLEKARGSPADNRRYCTKSDTRVDGPWEFGQLPKQGKRSDFDSLMKVVDEMLSDGKYGDEIFDEVAGLFPHIAFKTPEAVRRCIQHRVRMQRKNAVKIAGPSALDQEPPSIKLFWGPTGVGKTRRAHTEAIESGECNMWVKPPGPWFDGLLPGSKTVLLDEMPDPGIEIKFLLRLLDRHPGVRVPVKGGFVEWGPRVIYMTSNIPVSDWYPEASRFHRDALRRRLAEFGTMVHMDGSEESLTQTQVSSPRIMAQPRSPDWEPSEESPPLMRDGYAVWQNGYKVPGSDAPGAQEEEWTEDEGPFACIGRQ